MTKLLTSAQVKLSTLQIRAKEVITGKSAMTMVEIVVLISVILVIATVLFALKDQIAEFLTNAGTTISGLNTNVNQGTAGL